MGGEGVTLLRGSGEEASEPAEPQGRAWRAPAGPVLPTLGTALLVKGSRSCHCDGQSGPWEEIGVGPTRELPSACGQEEGVPQD